MLIDQQTYMSLTSVEASYRVQSNFLTRLSWSSPIWSKMARQ